MSYANIFVIMISLSISLYSTCIIRPKYIGYGHTLNMNGSLLTNKKSEITTLYIYR